MIQTLGKKTQTLKRLSPRVCTCPDARRAAFLIGGPPIRNARNYLCLQQETSGQIGVITMFFRSGFQDFVIPGVSFGDFLRSARRDLRMPSKSPPSG